MKVAKKALALVICAMMLATSFSGEGWYALVQSIKAFAIADHEQQYDDARVELDFNKGWKFHLGDDSTSYLKGFDDSGWEDVDLPHDFSINQEFTASGTEPESGNLPAGTGWYRKWFNLYEYYTGDRVFLNFDGAYQHTYVYVNGQLVGENHYGYNSFSFEISKYLLYSNTSYNLIAVKVVNDLPSSRWYSGSGIYRDVTLAIAGPVHVSLYGPQITTPGIKNGDGTANVDIALHNSSSISKKVTVETTILDDEHNAVGDKVTSSLITVPAQTEKTVTLQPKVNNPELWSLDSPNLYKLKTVIKSETGEILDEYHTTFGYRYIDWNAETGFSLNGENIKLQGVCIHHDQGAIGALQEYEALYRQVVTLKEMGANAIRTSHNSASRTLIDICNELGMLVIEEFFDGWDASKNNNTNDFSKYFNQKLSENNTLIGANGQAWFEFVVEQTILRDRHNPCIIAWDVGNELGNITTGESTANYENIAKSIVAIRNELDPSRVLLQGNNAPTISEATKMIDGYMDVIGGNYSLYG
ncbi:MAG: beta-galactosidase, partial [Clostridia bacterium]|nr:beta-galactosidase [Clostridia bacterium]